jgi:hypothetical protein
MASVLRVKLISTLQGVWAQAVPTVRCPESRFQLLYLHILQTWLEPIRPLLWRGHRVKI